MNNDFWKGRHLCHLSDPTRLLLAVQDAGYKVFTGNKYDMNMIGVRSSSRIPNTFDDQMNLVYWDSQDRLQHKQYRITTDPGTYWLQNPINVNGTAIMVAGQYKSAYQFGFHKGYEALTQVGPIKVYRDADRNLILDHNPSSVQEGWFGINIHRASTRSGGSVCVGKWSAGCQVFADHDEFADFLATLKLQIKYHPTWTKFTYTLLEAEKQ